MQSYNKNACTIPTTANPGLQVTQSPYWNS